MKKLKWMRPTLSRRVETRCELFADRNDAEPIYTSTVVTEGRHDLVRLGAVAALLLGVAAIALAVGGKKEKNN
ncbi:MAG: hypothetical protein IKT72_02400 [Clostridia bacterium]|nr:hypothetical protein [Clostridia bacterium]